MRRLDTGETTIVDLKSTDRAQSDEPGELRQDELALHRDIPIRQSHPLHDERSVLGEIIGAERNRPTHDSAKCQS